MGAGASPDPLGLRLRAVLSTNPVEQTLTPPSSRFAFWFVLPWIIGVSTSLAAAGGCFDESNEPGPGSSGNAGTRFNGRSMRC